MSSTRQRAEPLNMRIKPGGSLSFCGAAEMISRLCLLGLTFFWEIPKEDRHPSVSPPPPVPTPPPQQIIGALIDAPSETVVPYVSNHASLMRLPVSLLCYCNLYSFYKPLHCSKRHPCSHDQSTRMATKGITEFLLNLFNFIIFASGKFFLFSFYYSFPAAICIQ